MPVSRPRCAHSMGWLGNVFSCRPANSPQKSVEMFWHQSTFSALEYNAIILCVSKLRNTDVTDIRAPLHLSERLIDLMLKVEIVLNIRNLTKSIIIYHKNIIRTQVPRISCLVLWKHKTLRVVTIPEASSPPLHHLMAPKTTVSETILIV